MTPQVDRERVLSPWHSRSTWLGLPVEEDLPEEIGDRSARITPRAGATVDVDLDLPARGR